MRLTSLLSAVQSDDLLAKEHGLTVEEAQMSVLVLLDEKYATELGSAHRRLTRSSLDRARDIGGSPTPQRCHVDELHLSRKNAAHGSVWAS